MPIYPQLQKSMRKDRQRSVEVQLYDLLERTLPPGYTVIYGWEWTRKFTRVSSQDIYDPLTGEVPDPHTHPLGEIDFILITPKALLILEVKGGEITLENGTWFRIHHGYARESISDPLSQARKNRFAIQYKLQSEPKLRHKFIPLGYAVIFPHTPAWQLDTEDSDLQSLLLFQENVNETLIERLNSSIDFWKHLWTRDGQENTMSSSDIALMIDLLAPTARMKKPQLRGILDQFQAEVLTLTERQYQVLKGLSGNRKAIITGGAGTGKTLLAMEKARRTAAQGHKTLFTCANRLLSKHVKGHLKDIKNLEVMNFHELCYQWGTKAGIANLTDPDGPERNDLKSEYYNEVLPDALCEASALIDQKYQAVIVDEGQDMHEIYWAALQWCLTEDDPIFYIFCDPHQSIWHIKDKLPFEKPTYHLYDNLRNSRKIFSKLLKLCVETDYGTGCTHEGEYEIVRLKKGAAQIESKLQEILSRLTQEGISLKDISIITGKSRDHSRLADLASIGPFPLTRDLRDTTDKVLFSSVRQYRGMESAIVIMIEVDHIIDQHKLRREIHDRFEYMEDESALEKIAKETLLIGMSRAQHSLYILADQRTAIQLNQMGLGAKG